MSLTYRSTGQDERVQLYKDANGDKFVVRAVQKENGRSWDLSMHMPSGRVVHGIYHGDGYSVHVGMAKMAMDDQNNYRTEKNRGHKAAIPSYRDNAGMSISENGENSPPIYGFVQR